LGEKKKKNIRKNTAAWILFTVLLWQPFSAFVKHIPVKTYALPYLKTDCLAVAKAYYQKLILAIFI